MFWKPFLSLLLAGMLGAPGAAQPIQTKNIKITVLLRSMSGPENILMKNGAEAAANELGVSVDILGPIPGISPDAYSPKRAQLDMFQNKISAGCDVICVDPLDAEAAIPLMDQSALSKIPVLTIQHDIEHANKLSFLGMDAQAARPGGEYAATLSKKAVILRNADDSVQDIAESGFRAGLEGGGAQVLGVLAADGEPAQAVRTLLETYPDAGVLCVASDSLAIAAQREMARLGRGIPVIGFGCAPEALELVRDRTLAAMAVPEFYDIGALSVQLAVQAAMGRPIEKRIVPGAVLATHENAAGLLSNPHYNPGL